MSRVVWKCIFTSYGTFHICVLPQAADTQDPRTDSSPREWARLTTDESSIPGKTTASTSDSLSLLALRKPRCHVRCLKRGPSAQERRAVSSRQQPATQWDTQWTTRKEPTPANNHVNKPGGRSCPSEAFIWTVDSLNTTSSEALSQRHP